ncbi:MAG: redoxin domain-containing protein [Cyclobacteriaceae bacterium]|nr:redoxin domain-containing protein [Cyclobacteriaceae bacterium]
MKNLFYLLLIVPSITNGQASVADFSLNDVNKKTTVALSEFKNFNAIVVLFTTNECPFDSYYKTRVKTLIDSYSGKVQFLLINSANDPQETPEKMAIHYTDLGVPYLEDKEQIAMDLFGARKSLEAYLLKPEGNQFKVIYSGAIDDNPQVAADTKENYLKNAINKVLNSQKIEFETNRVIGCTIRR